MAERVTEYRIKFDLNDVLEVLEDQASYFNNDQPEASKIPPGMKEAMETTVDFLKEKPNTLLALFDDPVTSVVGIFLLGYVLGVRKALQEGTSKKASKALA